MLLASASTVSGMKLSRLKSPYRLSGYVAAIGCIFVIILARKFPVLTFYPPMSWLMHDRNEFALIGISFAMAIGSVLPQLKRPREKRLMGYALFTAVFFLSVIHFLYPAILLNTFRNIHTYMNPDGICMQSIDYTCGPAAAVTTLRRLDVMAEEGDLAITCHTTPLVGTSPDSLASGIERTYPQDNLKAEFRYFKDIDALRQTSGGVIAITKYDFLVDHYVAVLSVTQEEVVVGDPWRGKKTYTLDQFRKMWRNSGIVVERLK